MVDNSFAIDIAKKEIEKAVIDVLYKKDLISFEQYNFAIRKIDEFILKEEKEIIKLDFEQITVDFLI